MATAYDVDEAYQLGREAGRQEILAKVREAYEAFMRDDELASAGELVQMLCEAGVLIDSGPERSATRPQE